jgi:hypothetical protein
MEKEKDVPVEIVAEAGSVATAWLREMERIAQLSEKEPWEELLAEVAIAIGPTMNKILNDQSLKSHDYFLLEIWFLLLSGNADDRDLALAKSFEHLKRVREKWGLPSFDEA